MKPVPGNVLYGTEVSNIPLDIMSCQRWFSPPTSWLVQKLIFLTNHSADTCRTNTTTTKWQYKTMNDNYRHAKLNLMKLKPGSRRLLHLPARKRIRPTLQIPGPARGTHTLIQTDQTYSTAPRACTRHPHTDKYSNTNCEICYCGGKFKHQLVATWTQ